MNPTTTRALLAGGVVAGPLYMGIGVIEILIRPGFDIRRHELSLMSIGDLGWIQITSFLVTSLLVLGCAVAMRRVMRSGRGRTWGPLLIGLYGLGLLAAGVFVADPINGFPPGVPESNTISWHALLHFVTAAIAFIGLIAACFVFARRFASLQQRGWAIYSLLTGILFLGAFIGIASGAKQSALVLAFWGAVIIGWAWLSLLAGRLMSELVPLREART
jgi:uncharacterized protein DUF998